MEQAKKDEILGHFREFMKMIEEGCGVRGRIVVSAPPEGSQDLFLAIGLQDKNAGALDHARLADILAGRIPVELGANGPSLSPSVTPQAVPPAHPNGEVPTIGATFRTGSHSFKVVDYRPRSWKYPVIAERIFDGVKYKFSVRRANALIAETLKRQP